ncbi:MAG: type I-E CRISPR-associated protein Cas6/Cse3/CasE [Planctomycetota bacterium]|nr:type I-E CRISPR-associated protein Cas6/Cse3/CasE [Planctomycetota bacterium]MDA1165293.1 type I-E CRISPR-associated protein Cas6/Cse3/CasE [Planctomycetota bacterium]
MHLSSLILNPRSREARSDMHDVNQMHKTLLQAFPDKSEGGPGPVLWRLDTDRRTGICRVLIQSLKEPNWQTLTEHCPEYIAAQSAEGIPPVQSKPMSDMRFRTGQQLAFRLRANPTVKREGKRHGLLSEEDQSAWLQRKAETNGFRVVSVVITPERPRESGMGRTLKFASALFEGRLVIEDSDLFLASAIASGIGSAKAFGFGLLSVARV